LTYARTTSGFRWLRLTAMLLAVALLAAACGRLGGDDKVSDANPAVEGSQPTPGAALQERVEEATLTVENGKVAEDTLTLQENEPVVVHVVNKDTTGYRLRIPGFVTDTTINPSATTDVSFTTPKATTVEAQLLPATGDQALDTFQAEVQAPSGSAP
jgi:hypothetical protein